MKRLSEDLLRLDFRAIKAPLEAWLCNKDLEALVVPRKIFPHLIHWHSNKQSGLLNFANQYMLRQNPLLWKPSSPDTEKLMFCHQIIMMQTVANVLDTQRTIDDMLCYSTGAAQLRWNGYQVTDGPLPDGELPDIICDAVYEQCNGLPMPVWWSDHMEESCSEENTNIANLLERRLSHWGFREPSGRISKSWPLILSQAMKGMKLPKGKLILVMADRQINSATLIVIPESLETRTLASLRRACHSMYSPEDAARYLTSLKRFNTSSTFPYQGDSVTS